MNYIVIVSDSFRRDHLGCYGNPWIHTPNLDKLASESLVFDRFYTGSFPTIPHRWDLFTGRFNFTYSEWQSLTNNEVTLAGSLQKDGYTSYMIFDTPHLMNNGFRFDHGFNGWNWIRGQEKDRYHMDPVDIELPFDPEKYHVVREFLERVWRNHCHNKLEEEKFAAVTMKEAMKWLENNASHDKFYLHIDCFDPHEPWDPPQSYVDLYDPGYEGAEICYPNYGPCDYLTPAEIKHIRALYAGEATMVDHWIGKLLEKVEALGLADDTAIIFTSDHGFYHGEHGLMGKIMMLYEEVTRVPFMIRLPGRKPGRTNYRAQAVDVMPTLLELTGIPDPGTMHGKSFVPLLNGEESPGREFAVSSWTMIHEPIADTPQTPDKSNWQNLAWRFYSSTVATDEYTLMCGARDVRPELYHLPSDPGQANNIYHERKEVARELHRCYIEFLESVGTPAEYIDRRRTLPE